jgi:hypothetical protein
MESEAQSTPFVNSFTIDPTKFRDVIQTSINRVVDREIDIATAFKGRNIDGRFFNSFPSVPQRMRNAAGRPYFIVGASKVTCNFVAAP